MDPEVSVVSLVGKAGSGKTLLALAAALEQTIEKKIYKKMLALAQGGTAVGTGINTPKGFENKFINYLSLFLLQ